MPEGNEVHRWADRHNAAFAGKKMHVEGPNGRFQDAAALDGRRLERVLAVGKHLGYDFGKDRILHVHLGRYGDWTEGQMPLAEVRGMLRLRMWRIGAKPVKGGAEPTRRHGWYSSDDGTASVDPAEVDWLELRGPTDCSVYTQTKWDALLERLGPDPLNGDGIDPAIEKIRKAKKPIGVLLMEQDVMSGIGNIYRAELLFRARLSPFAIGSAVPETVLRGIWKEAKPLLKAGMVDRRIVTTHPKHRPHGTLKPPLKQEVHYVYRRSGKPCWVCGTAVRKQDMNGRSLYWCPVCQAE
jgi:endonuclease-8